MCTKPRSAALMKSTLWSIDLACGLIDAVFKNSLVWGMGELQGGRHSCRAHLSMFTEPEHSVSSEKRGLTGPPSIQWVTLSLCTRRTQKHAHTVPQGEEKKANILHILMHLHIYLRLLLIAWHEAPHPSLCAYCRLAVTRLLFCSSSTTNPSF